MFLKEKQNISKTDNCLSLDLFVISNVAGATYAQTYAQAGSSIYSEQPFMVQLNMKLDFCLTLILSPL